MKTKKRGKRGLVLLLALALVLMNGPEVWAKSNREPGNKVTDLSNPFNTIYKDFNTLGERRYHNRIKGRSSAMGITGDLDDTYGTRIHIYAIPKGDVASPEEYFNSENILTCVEANVYYSVNEERGKPYTWHANEYKDGTEAVRQNLSKHFGISEAEFQRAGQVINYARKVGGRPQSLDTHLFRLVCHEYVESKDVLYPSSPEDQLYSLKGSFVPTEAYTDYPEMVKDQMWVTEGSLMAMRCAQTAGEAKLQLTEAGQLDLAIPGYAVPGTRISNYDSVFTVEPSSLKGLAQVDGAVNDGIYRPQISLKEGTPAGIYQFTIARPNWNGPVHWRFFYRDAAYKDSGKPTTDKESTQFLGKFDIDDQPIYDVFTVYYKVDLDGKPLGATDDEPPADDPNQKPDEDPDQKPGDPDKKPDEGNKKSDDADKKPDENPDKKPNSGKQPEPDQKPGHDKPEPTRSDDDKGHGGSPINISLVINNGTMGRPQSLGRKDLDADADGNKKPDGDGDQQTDQDSKDNKQKTDKNGGGQDGNGQSGNNKDGNGKDGNGKSGTDQDLKGIKVQTEPCDNCGGRTTHVILTDGGDSEDGKKITYTQLGQSNPTGTPPSGSSGSQLLGSSGGQLTGQPVYAQLSTTGNPPVTQYSNPYGSQRTNPGQVLVASPQPSYGTLYASGNPGTGAYPQVSQPQLAQGGASNLAPATGDHSARYEVLALLATAAFLLLRKLEQGACRQKIK